MAFLAVFAIFLMTDIGYDVRCDTWTDSNTTGSLSFLSCFHDPEYCLSQYLNCHWAEIATVLCIVNNIFDELRHVSEVKKAVNCQICIFFKKMPIITCMYKTHGVS